MGRRKVEIKRIESKSSRQVTFCKRRNGLIEKARQLSVLCESSVAILMVSSTGKLYTSSYGDSMEKIIKRYEIQHADELKNLFLFSVNIYACSKCEEAKVDDASVESLNSLEEQFKAALSVTRARKTQLMMEFLKNLEEKEKLLREENQILASQLTKSRISDVSYEERDDPDGGLKHKGLSAYVAGHGLWDMNHVMFVNVNATTRAANCFSVRVAKCFVSIKTRSASFVVLAPDFARIKPPVTPQCALALC
uniref:MADS-box domain-containing protein n=1 Tax=Brassica campestris TaxID=3711 RepID=M4ESV6_BRACM